MRRLLVALSSAVSVVALTHMASAADLGPRVVYKAAPLAPPVQDWSGVYVGVEGGYAWGRQDGGTVPFLFLPRRDQLTRDNANAIAGSCCFFSGDNTLSSHHYNDFVEDFSEIQNQGAVNLNNVSNSGWLAGAFWGVQKQWGSLVLGMDADVEGADIKGTSSNSVSAFNVENEGENNNEITNLNHTDSLEAKIDLLGRFVGKVGWAISPNWMVYGDGGMAYAHVKDTLNDSQQVIFATFCSNAGANNLDIFDCDHAKAATNSIIASANQSMFGWTVGAGIDYKWQIDPGSAWIVGVDYRFYDFPSQTFTFSDPNTGLSYSLNSKQTVNAVQLRLSYLFSIH